MWSVLSNLSVYNITYFIQYSVDYLYQARLRNYFSKINGIEGKIEAALIVRIPEIYSSYLWTVNNISEG